MALQTLGSVPAALSWLVQHGVRGLATDSRHLAPGDAFIAWPGQAQDGRRHVYPALAAGAPACLVEAEGAEAHGFDDARIAAMDNLKAVTGLLASAFYGAPTRRLSVIAVTGTNGKTSTAWWMAQALSMLGRRCGVIGTLGIGAVPAGRDEVSALQPTGLTTPDPVALQRAFKRFADDGFNACAIEASSIGLAEQRLAGTHIDVAVLTNFTQDHLDYHGSMEAYWQSKADLFRWPGLRAAVVNLDDPQGAALQPALAGSPLDLWTYAVAEHATATSAARLSAHDVHYIDGGLAFDLVESGEPAVPLRTALIGDYNVSNLLAVVAALRALGVPLRDAAQTCVALTPVPGRMQRICAPTSSAASELPDVLVDYAHTPDALDKSLRALQPMASARGGSLWCVFGCGGDRDAVKRPLMGAIAQRESHRVVVTSDNPRHETPSAIIAAIVAGMAEQPRPLVIEDRDSAIAHAVRSAGPNDVVLIAGKGHEGYQEIAGVRLPFDDVSAASAALEARARSAELPP
ncbi:MAG: UDP-N-acetylmuramoyl-L-alanyl-D-glutamate--2,6-diaminopimelate ligase [Rhizobacter sp.]